MPKIVRATQEVFATDSGAVGVTEFGSTAAGVTVYSKDVEAIQTTAFKDGWLEAVFAGVKRLPTYEDMNAIHYVCTSQLAYLFQDGIPEWDAGTTYYTNSIVKKTGTYILYGSIVDDNIGNALTDVTKWILLADLSSYVSSVTGSGSGITVSPTTGAIVITSNATTAATPSTLAYRDASGDLSNAITATKIASNGTTNQIWTSPTSSTQGWQNPSAVFSSIPTRIICYQYSGDLQNIGGATYITYTTPVTYTPTAGTTAIQVVVIGAGGGHDANYHGGGGGGVIGYTEIITTQTITVGAGTDVNSTQGGSSSFGSLFTATGGSAEFSGIFTGGTGICAANTIGIVGTGGTGNIALAGNSAFGLGSFGLTVAKSFPGSGADLNNGRPSANGCVWIYEYGT